MRLRARLFGCGGLVVFVERRGMERPLLSLKLFNLKGSHCEEASCHGGEWGDGL